jgi:hypothetical protein
MNALRHLEQAVLAEGREWTHRRLTQTLQSEANRIEPLCPQTGRRLKGTRWRELQLDTVVGTVQLRVRHGYSPALHRWVCPAREAWGLAAYQRLSPEFQARLTYTVTEVGSYQRAAQMATTWGSPVSDGCLHEQVQRLGAAAQALDLPSPVPLPREPEFSLVIMMDGWMARERGPDWGASARKKAPERIAWHEIKSAVIYRMEQRAQSAGGRGLLVEKFAVATPPETTPLDFGAAVQAEARRRGLGRAKVVYLVMDGAVWLWDLAQDRFADAVLTLDFHHARDHLWALAHTLHGEDTPEAKAWVQPLLHDLRHGKETRVVRRLETLLESSTNRTVTARILIDREVNYFQTHRDHLHYEDMEEAGAPRGSGAAESLGKQFQARLRGCGQSWTRPGITHLLRLCVLVKNHDDVHLWN